MKFRIHITQETIDQMNLAAHIAIAQMARGETPELDDLREVLVSFLVDEHGKALDESAARRQIGRLKADELTETVDTFAAALGEYLLPKARRHRRHLAWRTRAGLDN